MKISFHGGAGGVTGSCHLVEAAGQRLLIDCGMYQGSRALDQENAVPFGFDPAAIDRVLLTHAHLDHCGRLPLLYKRGFRGRIHTTAPTAELAQLVLLDAAELQAEEMRRHPVPQSAALPRDAGTAAATAPNGHRQPLYEPADVLAVLALAQADAEYGRAQELAPGVRATFANAGHILGSAWILLELTEGATRRRVLFSGDLGGREKAIINPPTPAAPADVLVMESTYGDRTHKPMAPSIVEFKQAVIATLARGGNVVIPTFALERAQDLLYFLRPMVDSGQIPATTPIYLDSPMAISATEIFRRHAEYFNPAMRAALQAGHDPFHVPGLHFTRAREESLAINQVRAGAIIMAGSGMAAGGRVLHHLRHNLARRECSVIFVGYASRGTLARAIIDGARHVNVLGDVLPVHAQIFTIGGFSGHADDVELQAWAASSNAHRIFLVHGEPDSAAALARQLTAPERQVEYPALGQTVEL